MMSEKLTKDGDDTGANPAEKLVYVMPLAVDQSPGGVADDEISIKELWDTVWQGKWLIIAITAVFALGSVVYGLVATEWYRAEVLLAPAEAESTPSVGGQLGGLAALAGVSVGGGGGTAEAVATLNSRGLAREFIESNGLTQVLLYDDWDEASQITDGADPDKVLDIRDAVKVFDEEVLNVREDRETGLVTVIIEWIDPQLAADWASELVRLTNDRLRDRALQEANTNVAYLKGELATTNVVTLQQSIGRMLESEMQKLMLAKGNAEFAFRTVDAAEAPKKPSRPRRAVAAVIGTLLGGVISLFVVFVRHALRSE